MSVCICFCPKTQVCVRRMGTLQKWPAMPCVCNDIHRRGEGRGRCAALPLDEAARVFGFLTGDNFGRCKRRWWSTTHIRNMRLASKTHKTSAEKPGKMAGEMPSVCWAATNTICSMTVVAGHLTASDDRLCADQSERGTPSAQPSSQSRPIGWISCLSSCSPVERGSQRPLI